MDDAYERPGKPLRQRGEWRRVPNSLMEWGQSPDAKTDDHPVVLTANVYRDNLFAYLLVRCKFRPESHHRRQGVVHQPHVDRCGLNLRGWIQPKKERPIPLRQLAKYKVFCREPEQSSLWDDIRKFRERQG